MTDSFHEQVFVAPKGSFGLKLIAAVTALAVTMAVFIGYAYLRRRHAESRGAAGSAARTKSPEPKMSPKAMVLADDALIQGSKTIVGGTVRNTSAETLRQVSV